LAEASALAAASPDLARECLRRLRFLRSSGYLSPMYIACWSSHLGPTTTTTAAGVYLILHSMTYYYAHCTLELGMLTSFWATDAMSGNIIFQSHSLPFTMVHSHSHSHSRSLVLFPFLSQSHWLFLFSPSSISVLLVVSYQMTSKLDNSPKSTVIAKGLALVLELEVKVRV